jgi:hypothetical protein
LTLLYFYCIIMVMVGSIENQTFIVSPGEAAESLLEVGISTDVWKGKLAIGGMSHWGRTYIHIAQGAKDRNVIEVFEELNEGDPFLDVRVEGLRRNLAARYNKTDNCLL